MWSHLISIGFQKTISRGGYRLMCDSAKTKTKQYDVPNVEKVPVPKCKQINAKRSNTSKQMKCFDKLVNEYIYNDTST